MKKKNRIIEYDAGDGDGSIYEIAVTKDEKNDKDIKLWYYKHGGWSEPYRGAMALKIHDHGNGITITFPHENKKIDLDYSQAGDLMLALNYYDEEDPFNHGWTPRTRVFKKKNYEKYKKPIRSR